MRAGDFNWKQKIAPNVIINCTVNYLQLRFFERFLSLINDCAVRSRTSIQVAINIRGQPDVLYRCQNSQPALFSRKARRAFTAVHTGLTRLTSLAIVNCHTKKFINLFVLYSAARVPYRCLCVMSPATYEGDL